MTDEREDDGQGDRNTQAVAAAVGALVGLPFGPIGSVAGAALGPLLEPYVSEIIYLVGQAGKRRGAEAVAEACESTGLSVDDTISRIFNGENSQLLAATSIIAATRTTWEDKVRTLGRSLASGLLAADDADVDTEQLIMSAVSDIEAPHLALLDLLVAWRPPSAAGELEPIKLDIPEYSYSVRQDATWGVGARRWNADQIRKHRPRLTAVLSSLAGTLQRHGLVSFDTNSSVAIKRVENAIQKDITRLDQQQRTGRRTPRSLNPLRWPIAGTWEPTPLGEQVWLRFHQAGANVPDAWLPSDANSQTEEDTDPATGGA